MLSEHGVKELFIPHLSKYSLISVYKAALPTGSPYLKEIINTQFTLNPRQTATFEHCVKTLDSNKIERNKITWLHHDYAKDTIYVIVTYIAFLVQHFPRDLNSTLIVAKEDEVEMWKETFQQAGIKDVSYITAEHEEIVYMSLFDVVSYNALTNRNMHITYGTVICTNIQDIIPSHSIYYYTCNKINRRHTIFCSTKYSQKNPEASINIALLGFETSTETSFTQRMYLQSNGVYNTKVDIQYEIIPCKLECRELMLYDLYCHLLMKAHVRAIHHLTDRASSVLENLIEVSRLTGALMGEDMDVGGSIKSVNRSKYKWTIQDHGIVELMNSSLIHPCLQDHTHNLQRIFKVYQYPIEEILDFHRQNALDKKQDILMGNRYTKWIQKLSVISNTHASRLEKTNALAYIKWFQKAVLYNINRPGAKLKKIRKLLLSLPKTDKIALITKHKENTQFMNLLSNWCIKDLDNVEVVSPKYYVNLSKFSCAIITELADIDWIKLAMLAEREDVKPIRFYIVVSNHKHEHGRYLETLKQVAMGDALDIGGTDREYEYSDDEDDTGNRSFRELYKL